jgi:ketosteroid isomerase-like protein
MSKPTMSRRMLLEAGACALAATAVVPKIGSARAGGGLNPQDEQTVHKFYAAWRTKQWPALESMLADDFTFTSPNDDHIRKDVYKAECWTPNVNLIDHFELLQIAGNDKDVFVMYVCHVKGGKTLQNVEVLQVKEGKVESVRCYFGQQNSYPSAVIRQK